MPSPVYSLTFVMVAGATLLLLGLCVGWLMGRRMSPAGQKLRETERRLDQVLQEKKAYEDDVVEHFTETANLLNTLTDSYRNVHNQLAKGASSLCQGRGPVALERLEGAGEDGEIPAQFADIRPPLDYAPKTSPHEKGMLNEEFGIERERERNKISAADKSTAKIAAAST